jgi:hypothetical protein
MAGRLKNSIPKSYKCTCAAHGDHEACHDQDQIEEPQLLPLGILIPLAVLLVIMFLKRVAVYLFSFCLQKFNQSGSRFADHLRLSRPSTAVDANRRLAGVRDTEVPCCHTGKMHAAFEVVLAPSSRETTSCKLDLHPGSTHATLSHSPFLILRKTNPTFSSTVLQSLVLSFA